MRFLFCCFSIFSFGWLSAQNKLPSFASPVDTIIRLSGNFAELRSNHFHGGLDIKTNNHEGMKIYSVGDGYVSKVKVSSYNYGKMLYITHPSGHVSVYAHLQAYNDTIQKYVKNEQYKNQSFEVEFKLAPGQIPVKQGDFVALSGNTGASEGPHLHFEIRDTSTEIAFNPLLFGFDVQDHEKPVVSGLTVYPADAQALINNVNAPKKVKIIKSKNEYEAAETVVIEGNVYFGIEAYDSEDNSVNRNGIYTMQMSVDGEKRYSFKMDTVPFKETRCINTHVDYPEKLKSGKNIHRCYVAENNNLGIYHNVVNKGVVNFSDNNIHNVLFSLKDYFGNTSLLSLQVKSKKGVLYPEKAVDTLKNKVAHFNCKKKNKYETSSFSMELPAGIFYEDIDFTYSMSDTANNKYSAVHRVHNRYVPVHDYYDMAIKAKEVPEQLQSKLLIVANGNSVKSIKDYTYENCFVKCKTRLFGDFKVAIDTTAPVIKPLNIRNNKDVSLQESIRIIISDNLSGIKNYAARIDDNWVLMDYDYKKDLLVYKFDDSVVKGKHLFTLEVTDERGNASTYKASFIR